MKKEEWRDIPNYQGIYKISSLGRIINITTNKLICLYARGKSSKNRPAVYLSKNGIRTWYSLSRLVATVFIPNPENKPEVDHINRNPLDNKVENLRWVTKSENCQNRNNVYLAHNFDGKRNDKPVICVDVKTFEKIYFKKITSAAEYIFQLGKGKNIHTLSVNISACCQGLQKTCHGYIFKYYN